MTNFEGCYLTNAGLEMVNDTGLANLTFTKAVSGSGIYASEKEVKELVKLKEQRQEFGLDECSKEGSTAHVKFKIRNAGLTDGYQLSEIGIYAKDSSGEERLYCAAFATAGNTEEVPADNGEIPYITSVDIETVVSTDAEVSIIYAEDHDWTINYVKGIVAEIDTKMEGIRTDLGENNRYIKAAVSEVQYDLAEVAFQLSLRDLIDDSTLRNVIVDEIDSASAVNIVSGSYASGKVYI